MVPMVRNGKELSFRCLRVLTPWEFFVPEKPFPASDKYVHLLYADAIWKKQEFLASTDERFRPVNASMGPDGCLYVVDFYRGVIQHKRFLTSYLRRQSAERQLDKPIGLGRIYRMVPR